jgi:hypothetical protein
MLGKLKDLTNGVEEIARHANQTVDQFNDMVPLLEGLGLSVTNVRLGMGLLPEVDATVSGSVEAIEPDKIKKLIEQHRDHTLLVTLLEALRTAGAFKERLSALALKGVVADVHVGLPPKVSVSFVS